MTVVRNALLRLIVLTTALFGGTAVWFVAGHAGLGLVHLAASAPPSSGVGIPPIL